MPSSNTSIAEHEHGTTYGAAQRCQKVNGSACPKCARVRADYTAEWRNRNWTNRESGRMNNRARQRALTQLAHRHPEEFDRLYRVEMVKELKRLPELE